MLLPMGSLNCASHPIFHTEATGQRFLAGLDCAAYGTSDNVWRCSWLSQLGTEGAICIYLVSGDQGCCCMSQSPGWLPTKNYLPQMSTVLRLRNSGLDAPTSWEAFLSSPKGIYRCPLCTLVPQRIPVVCMLGKHEDHLRTLLPHRPCPQSF